MPRVLNVGAYAHVVFVTLQQYGLRDRGPLNNSFQAWSIGPLSLFPVQSDSICCGGAPCAAE